MNASHICSNHISFALICCMLILFLCIGTFDIYNISVTMLTMNRLCFTVEYIKGHKTLFTFLQLICPTMDYVQNKVIDSTRGCINIETTNFTLTCNLSATDIDAISNIDTTPAVVITVVLTSSESKLSTSYQLSSSDYWISQTPSPTGKFYNQNLMSNVLITLLYCTYTCIATEGIKAEKIGIVAAIGKGSNYISI